MNPTPALLGSLINHSGDATLALRAVSIQRGRRKWQARRLPYFIRAHPWLPLNDRYRLACDANKACSTLLPHLFVAFFHGGLAREFYPALVVDADALDPDFVADLDDVF